MMSWEVGDWITFGGLNCILVSTNTHWKKKKPWRGSLTSMAFLSVSPTRSKSEKKKRKDRQARMQVACWAIHFFFSFFYLAFSLTPSLSDIFYWRTCILLLRLLDMFTNQLCNQLFYFLSTHTQDCTEQLTSICYLFFFSDRKSVV